jgi:hypothetical protein
MFSINRDLLTQKFRALYMAVFIKRALCIISDSLIANTIRKKSLPSLNNYMLTIVHDFQSM